MIDLVFHGFIKKGRGATCIVTMGYSPTCSRKDARTGTCKATSKEKITRTIRPLIDELWHWTRKIVMG